MTFLGFGFVIYIHAVEKKLGGKQTCSSSDFWWGDDLGQQDSIECSL